MYLIEIHNTQKHIEHSSQISSTLTCYFFEAPCINEKLKRAPNGPKFQNRKILQ